MLSVKRILLIITFLIFGKYIFSQDLFEKYFSEGVMRVDFVMAGNSEITNIFFHKIIREPYWGGRKINLIDTLNYGDYYYTVKETRSEKIIFSGSFSTLFREWQTTSDAIINHKAFPNSLRFPFPLRSVEIEIFMRKKDHSLMSLEKIIADPEDPMIEPVCLDDFKVKNLISGESVESSVDIAILAEGYTSKEMRKFQQDAKKLINYMFSVQPFGSYQRLFNINLVYSASKESGSDIPLESYWRNTVFNSNFYTFGIERYLTVNNIWKVCDVASCVPYDQIIILVNSDRYGGGGIYNFYSICTSDHESSPGVLVHEFGHAFAGLGDEYFSSNVTYEDFYDPEFEPWEPNLSSLKNFESKWKDMVPEGIPVPTPADEKYSEIVGAFEGGGYVPKGIYRAQLNCRMNNNSADDFCKVCQRAIERMIHFTVK